MGRDAGERPACRAWEAVLCPPALRTSEDIIALAVQKDLSKLLTYIYTLGRKHVPAELRRVAEIYSYTVATGSSF